MQTNFLEEIEGRRLVIWFSCGVTSAVAAKIAIKNNAGKLPVEVVYCSVGFANEENGWSGEHEDNYRFLKDCENWLGHPIKILSDPRYRTVDEVVEKDKYMNGPGGAKCTSRMKVAQRIRFQRRETDIQVFGFDYGEIDRAFDFRHTFPDVTLLTPLITDKMFKSDCLALLKAVGIKVPLTYALGLKNANCIGCVKGGKGYWNLIRVLFPVVFWRRAAQERKIGASCINGTYLDELDPTAGRYEAEPDIECSGFCQASKSYCES